MTKPDNYVTVLTSSCKEQDVVQSYQPSANDYIVKPATFDNISQAAAQLGMFLFLLNRPPVTPQEDPI